MLVKPITRRTSQGGGYSPPKVANDNIRTPNNAANDNLDSQRLRKGIGHGQLKALPKVIRQAPRLLRWARLSPWVFALTTAGEFIYQKAVDEYTFSDLGPWIPNGKCPSIPLTRPVLEVYGGYSSRNMYRDRVLRCAPGAAPIGNEGENPFSEIPTYRDALIIGQAYDVPGTIRSIANQTYYRPTTSQFHLPTMNSPIPAAAIMPRVSPDLALVRTYAPEYIPIGIPVPDVAAFPRWKDLPEWEHPNRYVSNGTQPNAQLRPYQKPLEAKFEYSNAPIPKSDFIHNQLPPGQNVKERKMKLTGAGYAAWKAVGTLTEGVDFINVVYKSLPSEYKIRNASLLQKLQAIEEGWYDIDLLLLTENIIKMQVEDRVYGQIGKGLGQVSERLGLPVGFGVSSLYKTIRYSSGAL